MTQWILFSAICAFALAMAKVRFVRSSFRQLGFVDIPVRERQLHTDAESLGDRPAVFLAVGIAFGLILSLDRYLGDALLGFLLGFLVYNRPPATIHLGDSSSMLVGLFFGVISIRSFVKGSTLLSVAPRVVFDQRLVRRLEGVCDAKSPALNDTLLLLIDRAAKLSDPIQRLQLPVTQAIGHQASVVQSLNSWKSNQGLRW